MVLYNSRGTQSLLSLLSQLLTNLLFHSLATYFTNKSPTLAVKLFVGGIFLSKTAFAIQEPSILLKVLYSLVSIISFEKFYQCEIYFAGFPSKSHVSIEKWSRSLVESTFKVTVLPFSRKYAFMSEKNLDYLDRSR